MLIFPIFLIILGVILIILGVIRKDAVILLGFVPIMVGVFLIVIVTDDTPETPTALDVYRGRTTLQITYQDSIAIDSIVVYKK